MLEALDPKKDAAAAEQVVDKAAADVAQLADKVDAELKGIIDYFFAKASEFLETHSIVATPFGVSIQKKPQE
jgi:hypothetical protein